MTASAARLLDTNVVSEMMRREPEPRVVRFLDRIAEEGLGLAAISVWEILNGLGRLDPGRRRDDLGNRFQSLLDELFEDRIFDWTLAEARICARLMEEGRRRGEPLDGHLPDAMLAATAACRGLAIVTRDATAFRNTGVAVVDPWTDPPG